MVHTTAKKQKKKDEHPDFLDGVWACLLNDYLMDLVEDDDELSDESSSASSDSISTAALRAEKRRRKKMKKSEIRKQRLRALDEEAQMLDLEDASRASKRHPSGYSKHNSLDEAAKRLADIKKRKKKSRSHDRYEPMAVAVQKAKLRKESIKDRSRVSRPALEPDGSFSVVSTPSLSNASFSNQWIDSSKGYASSIDADGKIARKEWRRPSEKRNEASSARRASFSRYYETRNDRDDEADFGSQVNPIAIEQTDENKSWHSRRDLFESKHKTSRSSQLDSNEAALETKSSRSKKKDRLPRKLSSPSFDTLHAEGLETSPYGKSSSSDSATQRVDARASEENRLSELDEIRQKKLDRKEALLRIRAIKARIAKLET